MKAFKIIGTCMLLVGFGCLVGLMFSIADTRAFLAGSLAAQGEIIDLVRDSDRDNPDGRSTSLFPVIRFPDRSGKAVVFKSSTSASRGAEVGQRVQVRYAAENPRHAVWADSVGDAWGLSIFLSLFGLIIGGMGALFYRLGIRDDLNEKRARFYSKEIRAKVKEVVLDTSTVLNGRSPYRITAQWLNPETNEVHVFKSKNLWFDPSEFLKDEVLVKADARNLKKYWMDVSFLPKQA
ncbi:MAG: hypothetical protein JWO30_3542 [Fibrobacteres bacterium]|nr:hypothetical protein [Fibrobacterota bacterium]